MLKLQNAARNSTEWFENVARYAQLAPEQFAYSLITRSQQNLPREPACADRNWLESYERWLSGQRTSPENSAGTRPVLPMLLPVHGAGRDTQEPDRRFLPAVLLSATACPATFIWFI